jgi:hypothetical protein
MSSLRPALGEPLHSEIGEIGEKAIDPGFVKPEKCVNRTLCGRNFL